MNLKEQKEKQARCEKCAAFDPHEKDYTDFNFYHGECTITEEEVEAGETCKGWGKR